MPPAGNHQYVLVPKGELRTYGYLLAVPSKAKPVLATHKSGQMTTCSVRPTQFSSGLPDTDPELDPRKGAVHKMVAIPPLKLGRWAVMDREPEEEAPFFTPRKPPEPREQRRAQTDRQGGSRGHARPKSRDVVPKGGQPLLQLNSDVWKTAHEEAQVAARRIESEGGWRADGGAWPARGHGAYSPGSPGAVRDLSDGREARQSPSNEPRALVGKPSPRHGARPQVGLKAHEFTVDLAEATPQVRGSSWAPTPKASVRPASNASAMRGASRGVDRLLAMHNALLGIAAMSVGDIERGGKAPPLPPREHRARGGRRADGAQTERSGEGGGGTEFRGRRALQAPRVHEGAGEGLVKGGEALPVLKQREKGRTWVAPAYCQQHPHSSLPCIECDSSKMFSDPGTRALVPERATTRGYFIRKSAGTHGRTGPVGAPGDGQSLDGQRIDGQTWKARGPVEALGGGPGGEPGGVGEFSARGANRKGVAPKTTNTDPGGVGGGLQTSRDFDEVMTKTISFTGVHNQPGTGELPAIQVEPFIQGGAFCPGKSAPRPKPGGVTRVMRIASDEPSEIDSLLQLAGSPQHATHVNHSESARRARRQAEQEAVSPRSRQGRGASLDINQANIPSLVGRNLVLDLGGLLGGVGESSSSLRGWENSPVRALGRPRKSKVQEEGRTLAAFLTPRKGDITPGSRKATHALLGASGGERKVQIEIVPDSP